MSKKAQALAVDADSAGVSDRVTDERVAESAEDDHGNEPQDLTETSLRRAVDLFRPEVRRGNAKTLEVRVKPGGDIIITEAEPPTELVEAIEQQVLAEARARVVQVLTPAPVSMRPVRRAPPPVPTKPVSPADRERARKALTRVGIHVRRGDKP